MGTNERVGAKQLYVQCITSLLINNLFSLRTRWLFGRKLLTARLKVANNHQKMQLLRFYSNEPQCFDNMNRNFLVDSLCSQVQ